MDSKSTTPSAIRVLVQFYLVSGEESYKAAAIRAGRWAFDHNYKDLEYRGGTCDNADIQDKEAGIYALFGFLALYDLTGEERWLEGAIGAADYTETWTYAWSFPVDTIWPRHPFNRYSISGQSIITIGGGADVYMAACSYTYYRLYVITGDEHYLDFAEFIHNNTRQSTDVDGSIGYAMPGLGHESGNFTSQRLQSNYHWLPWCTFVEVDPASRLRDTFGVYEIAEAQKLPPEERAKRNRIYDTFGKGAARFRRGGAQNEAASEVSSARLAARGALEELLTRDVDLYRPAAGPGSWHAVSGRTEELVPFRPRQRKV